MSLRSAWGPRHADSLTYAHTTGSPHARTIACTFLAASAAKSWTLARVRPLELPAGALQAVCFLIEVALLVGPMVAITMSAADAVTVFLIVLLLWVSLCLKVWLRVLRSPGARQQMALISQHLTEPRKR